MINNELIEKIMQDENDKKQVINYLKKNLDKFKEDKFNSVVIDTEKYYDSHCFKLEKAELYFLHRLLKEIYPIVFCLSYTKTYSDSKIGKGLRSKFLFEEKYNFVDIMLSLSNTFLSDIEYKELEKITIYFTLTYFGVNNILGEKYSKPNKRFFGLFR